MSEIVRIVIQPDYDRAESSGAEGMFQVITVYGYNADDEGFDLTHKIDQGAFFRTGKGAAKKLGFIPEEIDIELED
ncbi:hypothetical protein J1TS5_04000 [Paenibacillus macerans]|uniref:hypothetical protein n=1 Tax=Paenibacillus macerans TaxID=44252 RepID=UPI001B261BBD|nr:hypothetical protein [Paenibacillus macerans]GIP08230.1 hypothetical protein J1TS5_04000 [Paenibacillus macerans]